MSRSLVAVAALAAVLSFPATGGAQARSLRGPAHLLGNPVRVAPTADDADEALEASDARASTVRASEGSHDGATAIVRIPLELLLGAVGYVLGAGVGALVAEELDDDSGEVGQLLTSLAIGAVTGWLAGGIGVAGGVCIGGSMADGHGDYGSAFLGQFLGSAGGIALFLYALDQGEDWLGIAALIGAPTLGAVIAYEISGATSGGHPDHTRASHAALQLRSVIAAPTPDGRGAAGALTVVF